jgi:adenosylmethionine-8-amino-7-oxononanoate aminotransferase
LTTPTLPATVVFHRRLDRPLPRIVRAAGVYLYDDRGRDYLDAASGAVVVNIGHGRSEVADAMAGQAAAVAYAHNSAFTTEALEEACRALAELVPAPLDRIYLVHGGSEGVETAFKLARQIQVARGHTDKHRIVSCRPSYHGSTLGALAASGRPPLRRPFEPMLIEVPQVPAAYCYRCALGKSYPSCGVACATSLEEEILRLGADTVAAFIVEPIGGAASGGAVPPDDYLPRVREICDRHDVLLIADEVMTGLGRTGRTFAVEHSGVRPDLLVIGKGLGSGYAPAGAVAVSSELVDLLRDQAGKFNHGFTYSHHAVVAAACREVLAILVREGLLERGAQLEERFFGELRRLERFPFVGDVRGRGLLAGIELVADRASKRPFPRSRKLVEELTDRALDNGLVLWPSTGCADGENGDVVLVAPPLVVSEEEITELSRRLEKTFAEIGGV